MEQEKGMFQALRHLQSSRGEKKMNSHIPTVNPTRQLLIVNFVCVSAYVCVCVWQKHLPCRGRVVT